MSIVGVGGVAGGFQSVRPAHIIIGIQQEEGLIAWTIHQEKGMILIGFASVTVFAEALVLLVVVVVNRRTVPAVTLNAKVIIGLCGESASAGARLEESLCEDDTGRNTVRALLAYSNFVILLNILTVELVGRLSLQRQQERQKGYNQYESFHLQMIRA